MHYHLDSRKVISDSLQSLVKKRVIIESTFGMRPIFTLLLTCFLAGSAQAQLLGGSNTYDFLNLSESARVTGVGGSMIAVKDDDAVLGFQAPSLLNASMHQQLSFNHAIYVSGINYGLSNYAHHFDGINSTFNFGIQYVSYGKFQRTDETGLNLGTFSPSEYSLVVGAAHQYSEHLSFGANVKLINSFFEDYTSIGMAADIAGTYADTAKQVVLSLVFKNAGMQFSKYNPDEQREPLPFDVQFGISKRLKHIPFRFGVTAHHLHRWNIRYDDPDNRDNNSLFVDEPTEEKNSQSLSTISFDTLFLTVNY